MAKMNEQNFKALFFEKGLWLYRGHIIRRVGEWWEATKDGQFVCSEARLNRMTRMLDLDAEREMAASRRAELENIESWVTIEGGKIVSFHSTESEARAAGKNVRKALGPLAVGMFTTRPKPPDWTVRGFIPQSELNDRQSSDPLHHPGRCQEWLSTFVKENK